MGMARLEHLDYILTSDGHLLIVYKDTNMRMLIFKQEVNELKSFLNNQQETSHARIKCPSRTCYRYKEGYCHGEFSTNMMEINGNMTCITRRPNGPIQEEAD